MKLPSSLLLLIACSTLLACSTTKQKVKRSTFVFSVQESVYKITSLNTPSGEGSNILASVNDSDHGNWAAKDLDQDGTLDVILKGSASLDFANEVYWTGIEQAKNNGQYKSRYALRSYELITEESILTIRSYIAADSNPTNMFIIFNKLTNAETILVDTNADGILNRTEKGILEIESAQKLYTETLEKGILDNRITLINEVYLVKEYSLDNYLSKK
ncbi:MAG: hypothetical protein RLN81_02050 [Balneolaceae bacterium]